MIDAGDVGASGIGTTVANQTQYSFAASAYDVLRRLAGVERAQRHRSGADRAQGAPNPRLVDRDVMVYALFRNEMIAFWRCTLSP